MLRGRMSLVLMEKASYYRSRLGLRPRDKHKIMYINICSRRGNRAVQFACDTRVLASKSVISGY